MKEITLDECITPALRVKIKKLVELNLDIDSIWDLLEPNLKNYQDFMYDEIEKYIKYVLWLRDTDRPLEKAYEKYKAYTQNYNRKFKRDLATRLELEQKWRDQERIDQLSALMKYGQKQKNNVSFSNKTTESTISSFKTSKEPDEVVEPKNETYKENDVDDTESDLDFIDLSKEETTVNKETLNTKDLLFETMSIAETEANSVTIGLPIEQTPTNDLKEETISNEIENNKTDKALVFYEKLEDKYGSLNQKIKSPLSSYQLGAQIIYKNQEYLVTKIETVDDFFNKPEVVVTLKNLKNNTVIHVNNKQLNIKK